MTDREKRIFFNWLQKHGALKHYRKNRHLFLIDPSRRLSFIPYADMRITSTISSAFAWINTEQRSSYWSNLDYLWCNSKEYNQFFPI